MYMQISWLKLGASISYSRAKIIVKKITETSQVLDQNTV